MKQNSRLRLKVGLFIVVILVVIGLLVRMSSKTELLEGHTLKLSEVMTYITTNEEPNAFIIYGMVKKHTDDEQVHKKVLTLATEKKWGELKEVLRTI